MQSANLVLKALVVMPWLVYLVHCDVTRRRLPNGATCGGFLLALLLQYVAAGWTGVWDGFLASLVALAFIFVPFLLRAAGAGDVKMLMAGAAFLSLRWVPLYLMFVSFAGFGVAVWMLLARRASGARLRHYVHCLFDFSYDRAAGRAALPPATDERMRIPFGVAIALGLGSTLALAFLI